MNTRSALSALLVMCAAVGCATTDEDDRELSLGDHVVATTMFTPDGETSLIGLVPDAAEPSLFDRTRALERGGASAIFAARGGRVFSLGSAEDPTVIRYAVSDGEFAETGRMSLAAAGLSSSFKRSGLVPFVSDTKAYWLDDGSKQVVIWDPSDMSVTGTIPLDQVDDPAYPTWEFGERAVVRDGLLFVGLRYRRGDDGEAGIAAGLVLNTETNQVVSVLRDKRCGDTVHVLDVLGTLYFGSGAIAAILHRLGNPADYPAPCLLRIPRGELSFDPHFHVTLPNLVEGRAAGRIAQGQDGTAYVMVLHEEELAAPLGPETELWAPWEAAAWRWWRIELETGAPGRTVEGPPLATPAGWLLSDGERDYIPHVDIEAGETTLFVAQEGGGLAAGLRVPGLPYGIAKLRREN